MLGLGFEITKPPGWFFDFPPRLDPAPVAPPQDVFDWRAPFNVDPSLYRALLEPKVPLTVATVYFFTVKILNQINRRRGFKPYAFSKNRAWWLFCVIHNIFLAVYSGVTFAAMARAMYISLPGFFGPKGFAGQFDALCKMHGPRGWGDAITYNPETSAWKASNHFINLGADSLPDYTDVGRIWNEGLAFWGWLFYLSKFYEVVDTAIILASGKRSATLQTYHHTGAMLCMWAGIRFMSPPIWLFVYLNSLIHTIMYTYYTLHLFKVQVPKRFKRVLTTAQITQFLIGVYYATSNLFISYKIPVSVPVGLASAISAAPSAISSAASQAFGSKSLSSLAAQITADNYAWLKKLALRAADFEGPAENIWTGATERYSAGKGTRYVTSYQTVRCLDTNGQAFAIWLNVVYLAPLTFLFGRFFLKAYIWQSPNKNVAAAKGSKSKAVEKVKANGYAVNAAATEAARKTSEEFERKGSQIERQLEMVGHEIRKGGEDLRLEERLARLEQELKSSHSSSHSESHSNSHSNSHSSSSYTTSSVTVTSSGEVREQRESREFGGAKLADTSVESYADAVKMGDKH